MNYFKKLKAYMLPIILEKAEEFTNKSDNKSDDEDLESQNDQNGNKRSATYSYMTSDNKKSNEVDNDNVEATLSKIMAAFFEKLQEDFEKINVNEEIIAYDLVA